jgi:hypothetical protein
MDEFPSSQEKAFESQEPSLPYFSSAFVGQSFVSNARKFFNTDEQHLQLPHLLLSREYTAIQGR